MSTHAFPIWRGRNFGLAKNLAMVATLFVLPAFSAHADLVRITTINGEYEPNHATVVEVQPGDTVQFAADSFSQNPTTGEMTPQNKYVEDFTWDADDRAGQPDSCDPVYSTQCQENSSFEVTDYGVSFYVPYDMTAQIKITVRNRTTFDFDEVTLQNSAYATTTPYTPPTQVVTQPEEYATQYGYTQWNTHTALAGTGRWVVIFGSRYWVPYTTEAEWQPYQNGYWSWVVGDGWTWISYDPWGWVTDHYGIWRHHGTYGWMWLPFETFTYRPHTVSWFYGEGYVGWYPYHEGWHEGYRHGYTEGFIDGYWDGYNAGRFYGSEHHFYNPGFTYIHQEHFGHYNIHEVCERGRPQGLQWWTASYQRGQYGQYLGGRSHEESYSYVRGFNANIRETTVASRRFGDVEFRSPVANHAIPPQYTGISMGRERFGNRPISVGSIITRESANPVGGGFIPGRVIPPMSNGRGIGEAPRFNDPQTGMVRRLPPTVREPSIPNPENGFSSRPRPGFVAPVSPGLPTNPGFPSQPPMVRPPFNPGTPNPTPTFRPRPVPESPVFPRPVGPVGPGPVNPQPRPTFQPGPVNPQPRPTFEPVPQPRPTFNPGPVNPQPRPTFEPAPQPRPTFQPAPQPQPQPRPTFQPAPQPRPTFQPAPQPRPQPQPTYTPRPGPVTPGPGPRPGPVAPVGPRPRPHDAGVDAEI